MPLYLIERNFAEQVNATPEIAAAITEVNANVGIEWLFSFLSADKRKPTVSTRRRTRTLSVRQRAS